MMAPTPFKVLIMIRKFIIYSFLVCLILWVPTIHAAELKWINIPNGAMESESLNLVDKEISRHDESQMDINFRSTIPYYSAWRDKKQTASESWQSIFSSREKALRQAFRNISEHQQKYIEMMTDKGVVQITLVAREKALQSHEEKGKAIAGEIRDNERNLKNHLKDIPFQVLVMGSAKISRKRPMTVEAAKELLGDRMKIEAVRGVVGTKIEKREIIKDQELFESKLRAITQGKAEVIGIYPVDIYKRLEKDGKRIGRQRYLFHALGVYPFQPKSTDEKVSDIGAREEAFLDLPEVEVITRDNYLEVLQNVDSAHLKPFIEDWLNSIDKHNNKIVVKIDKIVADYKQNKAKLWKSLVSLQKDRAKLRCKVLDYMVMLDGDSKFTDAHRKWRKKCKKSETGKYVNLNKNFDSWKQNVWPVALYRFSKVQAAYQEHYSKRVIWLDHMEDGKLEVSPVHTWQQIAQKAFKKISKAAGELNVSENVLIVNDVEEEFEEQIVKYRPIPGRFVVNYISSQDFNSQELFLVHMGVEFKLSSKASAVLDYKPRLPKLAFGRAKCTKSKLKKLLDNKISTKSILDWCGESE
jgi:hypothetical protein